MKKFFATFFIITIIVLAGFSSTHLTSKQITSIQTDWEYYQGTEQSIREYFDNNISKLDPIEGLFTLSIKYYDKFGNLLKSNDNWSRLAIVRDKNSLTREFIEVNLQTDGFPKYAITADFTKASNGLLYLSKQFSPDGTFSNENFTWDNDLEMLLSERVEYTERGTRYTVKRYYTKIYPKKSSVIIEKKSKLSGTCFAISKDGLFATNFHVVENNGNVSIMLKKGTGSIAFKAKVILKDENNDIAIIQIVDTVFKPFNKIPYNISEQVNLGAKVFTIGYPLTSVMGENIKFTEGSLSSKSGFQDDIRFFQISVPIQPGNSGGPLFNSKGQVIGIITAKLNGKAIETDIQNVNYAMKCDYLLNVLKMLPKKPEIITNVMKTETVNSNEILIERYKGYVGVVISEQ